MYGNAAPPPVIFYLINPMNGARGVVVVAAGGGGGGLRLGAVIDSALFYHVAIIFLVKRPHSPYAADVGRNFATADRREIRHR